MFLDNKIDTVSDSQRSHNLEGMFQWMHSQLLNVGHDILISDSHDIDELQVLHASHDNLNVVILSQFPSCYVSS
jgi:hypothetical protein